MKKIFCGICLAIVSYIYADVPPGGGLFTPQNQSSQSSQSNQSGNSDPSSQSQMPTLTARSSGFGSSGSSDPSDSGLNLDNQQSNMNNNNNLLPPSNMKKNQSYAVDVFQNNVLIRTGLFMQNYGYNMFNAPTTFAPVNSTPVDANYTIGPGDQIYVQGWGTINVNYTSKVANDGTIFIPKVGQISVVGIKASSLESYLKNKIGRLYRNFTVSATVSQVRSIQVYVTGFALSPGTYQLSALSTLTNAVFAVGGPDKTGSLRRIQVRRNGITVADFDMYDVLLRGDTAKDIRLLPGDIIFFPAKGSQVAIYDGVKVPGIYEARTGETIKDIVKYAGGYTFDNKRDKVIIEDLDNHQGLKVLTYKFDDGLQQAISNGQIIHFFTAANRYQNSIVLIGNVVNPSRFQYTKGMRVKDIIYSKELLLTKSFWNSYSYNTMGIDNQLGLSGREKTTNMASKIPTNTSNSLNGTSESANNSNSYSNNNGSNNGNNINTNESVFEEGSNLVTAGPIRIPDADINWNYATIVRIDPNDYSSHVVPFNLGKAIAGDAANNILLQPGDVINVLSSKDVRISQNTKPVFVFIDGEVKAPGVYELKFGQTISDVIKDAGGLTNQAYLFGMELDRDSVKKKQQIILNQMIDQMQQNLLLQASNSALNTLNQAQAQSQTMVFQQQQALLDKLRQVKPVGRVVLGLDPEKIAFDKLPQFALENGDTVYIPALPSTVDVIGQVYNPATFVYKSGNSVGDYIHMAGTENQFADSSSEFVLRADGSIYSKQQAGWFGRFASRDLNPGDTVIVPQDIQFTSGIQNLLNWTQILANFGTAAAAITVFKN